MEEEPKKDPEIVQMIKSDNKPYRRNDKTEMLPSGLQKYALKIINECGRHHLDIINLCMSLEDEITSLMLVQMMASVIMLCFNLFQLSLVRQQHPSFLSHNSSVLAKPHQFFFCKYLILFGFDGISTVDLLLEW